MIRSAVRIGIVFSLLCWITGISSAKDFRIPMERRIDAGKLKAVDISWINGDCQVIPADTDQIVIQAVKKLDALSAEDAQDLADHIQIPIEQIDGRLVVSVKYVRSLEKLSGFWQKMLAKSSDDAFGTIDWIISVPEGFDVTLTSGRGTIVCEQLRNNLHVNTSASDITLSSIEGDIAIDNGSGRLQGNLIIGNCSIRQMLGSVSLDFVEGDIRVKATAASVSVSQERGALDLTTTTGDVDVRTVLDSKRDFMVSTESGDIRLAVPQEASGRLKLNTKTGEIKTDMPVAISSMSATRLDGVLGEGGVRVVLTSASGDVCVAQF